MSSKNSSGKRPINNRPKASAECEQNSVNSGGKIVLVGIYDTNTVSLAPNILKSYVQQFDISRGFEIETMEFSIFSHSVESIVNSIKAKKPDVVGFSTYIWNINEVLEVVTYLDATVIIGGPQVTGIENALIRRNPHIDVVVTGEGEETFKELLEYFAGQRKLETIRQITTHNISTPPRETLQNLDAVPSVYQRIFNEHPDLTWISLETSRGCPMGCKFCTWGYSKKMRYYPLERVKKELGLILSQENIKNIYLCDSSLLLNKTRAKEILKYIINSGTDKPIRFEFSAEQLDDEIIALLSQMPNDEFNFGLQTINETALREMGRKFNKIKFEENYQKMIDSLEQPNVTIDLIYGLPGDDIAGFKESLDYVISLDKVKRILTNPLISLPGSQFFQEMDKYGIRLRDKDSYLVKETSTFSEGQMEMARKYSFYVSVIYFNFRLLDCVKSFAEHQGERYIDVIIQFMETLSSDIVSQACPDMIPSIRDGFDERNAALREIIEKYDDIVDHFNAFSNHRYDSELADYPQHFSEQYRNMKRFAHADTSSCDRRQ